MLRCRLSGGGRLRRLLLVLLLLLKLLLLKLLLLLLGQVMADHTSSRSARNSVMTSNMTRYAAHDGALDTTLRCCALRGNEEGRAEQGCGKH